MAEETLTTREWALLIVEPHIGEIERKVKERFLARPPEEQRRLVDSVLTGKEPLTQASFEQTLWAVLHPSCEQEIQQAVQRVQHGLEDGMFRLRNKADGTGLDQTRAKAKQGDKLSLLELIRAIPDIQYEEPFQTLVKQANHDPAFRKQLATLPRKTIIHGNKTDYLGLLIFLSVHIELVHAVAAQTADRMTFQQLFNILEQKVGDDIDLPDTTNFPTWLKRNFKDIFSSHKTL